MAADVYAVSPHTGRGGWTWYTGSSGWMYRVGIGEILGFARKAEYFTVNPCIPEDWPGFSMKYRYGSTIYMIEVANPNRVQGGIVKVTLDGQQVPSDRIPLVDDGKEHQVIVTLGIGS